MGLLEARYYCEHERLPEMFFENKNAFIKELLDEDRNLLYELITQACEAEKIVCPYTENQYSYRKKSINDTYDMLKLIFPNPEEKLLCSSVYLVFDKEFADKRYFTVERDCIKGRKRIYFLCEWDSDHTHYNYGRVPNGMIEQEKMVERLIL